MSKYGFIESVTSLRPGLSICWTIDRPVFEHLLIYISPRNRTLILQNLLSCLIDYSSSVSLSDPRNQESGNSLSIINTTLSLSLSLNIYLSINLSIYLSIFLSLSRSLCFSLSLSLSLSIFYLSSKIPETRLWKDNR